MLDAFLVPEKTVVTSKGDGPVIDVSATSAVGKTFLALLKITRIIEQESLNVSVLGSQDGAAWEPKPLAAFPQKFYAGEHPLLLDLSKHPGIRFLRAHWEVGRWGRGTQTPMFEFQLRLQEVPAEMLQEHPAVQARK